MYTSNDFSKKQFIDLSDAIAVANPQATPYFSYIYNRKKTKATNTIEQRRVKTLSTAYSGGKQEGQSGLTAEKTQYDYVQNKTEIFSKVVELSGTAQALASGQMAKEVLDRIEEISRDIEKAMINNLPSSDRTMTGLNGTAPMLDATGTLNDTILNQAYTTLFQKDCVKDVVLLVHPADKYKLDAIILNKDLVRVNLNAGVETAGISVFEYWTSLGFKVSIMPTISVPQGSIFLCDVDMVELPVLREVHSEPLAKTGDAEEELIVGELTFIIPPQCCVHITNF